MVVYACLTIGTLLAVWCLALGIIFCIEEFYRNRKGTSEDYYDALTVCLNLREKVKRLEATPQELIEFQAAKRAEAANDMPAWMKWISWIGVFIVVTSAYCYVLVTYIFPRFM